MKKLWVWLVLLFLLLTAACSNSSSDENYDMAMNDSANEKSDFKSSENQSNNHHESNELEINLDDTKNNQMIIYTGNIDILVNDYTTATNDILDKVQQMNGFIVQSSEYQHGENENKFGEIVVRIPQEHFQSFMNHVETTSTEVLSKTTEGTDVTEEYVDLESRLRSKEAVEERLISFMNDAEKTEDLLKISNDLSTVQEEIERIKGKMNYLENHVSFSTITINIQEKRVTIPEIQSTKELNTMENATKLFMDTINFILNVASKIVVIFIGLSPIIVPLLIVGVFILIRVKRSKRE
ncbi:DUF4349 domain-containing protein [Bacillaceae bacterium W0354]